MPYDKNITPPEKLKVANFEWESNTRYTVVLWDKKKRSFYRVSPTGVEQITVPEGRKRPPRTPKIEQTSLPMPEEAPPLNANDFVPTKTEKL